MKRIIFSFLFLLSLSVLVAQESEFTISADRPGMATGVDIMPFKKVQFETGFQWDYSGTSAITLPTAMFRFGLSDFAELRLQYDGTLVENPGAQWSYNVEPLTIGTKIKVLEGGQYVPAISFMANLAIPSTSDLAHTMHVAPSLYLLFQNDITDWFNVGYNVGVEWNGEDAIPATFLAICLGFGITDNFGAFLESYNYFTRYDLSTGKTAVDANLDFGFNYIVHPRIQLDLYASFNCQDPKSYSNIGLGVAWFIN